MLNLYYIHMKPQSLWAVVSGDTFGHHQSKSLVFLKSSRLHSKLCSITPMATKVHVILQSFVVLIWMRGIVEINVPCDTMELEFVLLSPPLVLSVPLGLPGQCGICIRTQDFPSNCTHTQTMPINNDLCSPMPTHSMTCAHPCPPMLFKLRPCIKKLCNVCYPPTPSLGWTGQIKGCSLSLASTRSAIG